MRLGEEILVAGSVRYINGFYAGLPMTESIINVLSLTTGITTGIISPERYNQDTDLGVLFWLFPVEKVEYATFISTCGNTNLDPFFTYSSSVSLADTFSELKYCQPFNGKFIEPDDKLKFIVSNWSTYLKTNNNRPHPRTFFSPDGHPCPKPFSTTYDNTPTKT